MNARTPIKNLSDISDVDPGQKVSGSQPAAVEAGELSRLQQLIMRRPGERGGVLTWTEFEITKFCTEEKLRTKLLIVSFL